MRGSKSRAGQVVAFFLLLATACLASGAALAQCVYEPAATSASGIPQYPLPGTGENTSGLPTNVPCYVTLQPIDVCGTTGLSTCAPFNSTSANGVGVPNGNTTLPPAGFTGTSATSPGAFMNTMSPNPIYFVVDPKTGQSPPPAGDMNGVDVHRAVSVQLGYDVLLMPMKAFNSPINPATNTTFQTLNVTEDDTKSPPVFTSSDFQTLSFQPGFSQGQTPTASTFPNVPWAAPNIVESYSVIKLNPPPQQAGGKLHGFGWICNKAIATDQSIYGYPVTRPPSAQSPLTPGHELGHNMCLNHSLSFGAGGFTLPAAAPAAPYAAPAGVVLVGSSAPLLSGECDSSYPACGKNLMTAGNVRTEATPACVLVGFNGTTTVPAACGTGASQLPGLYNGKAGQVTTFSTDPTQKNLPLSQQQEVLAPLPTPGTTLNSGLLSVNPNFPVIDPPMKSGLLNPIPLETTKAQAETGGSTGDAVTFDVSSPIGGRPGETLVAWILMLPKEQTFAGDGRFHIISQSRKDLVERVDYFPEAERNPLMRNIAYHSFADETADNRIVEDNTEIGPYNACIARMAECLKVEFQRPGLGAKDSIKFSKSILSGGAPITNNDLCKAKITYVFSDGYATTTNFGSCPAASLPLIASSWRPDLTVSPWMVKSNVLLVDGGPPPQSCTPDPNTGLCPPLTLADANPKEDWGQGDLCSSGGINGVIKNNVTVLSGQYCVFNKGSQIRGNLYIQPGGSVYLDGALLGVLNDNGGALLKLDASATVYGNVNITDSSAFVIAGAEVVGNLNITDATGTQQGFVSGALIQQNVTVEGSQSPIQINGNTIGQSLTCTGNNPVPTGLNTVSGKSGVSCTN
jgi:hypothetical protein